MTTAPNAQAKGLDADKLRELITARLRGYPPYNEGMSLRHFCLQLCDPPVDPSNISDFRAGKRAGVSPDTVVRLARGLEVPVHELYRDDDPKAEAGAA